MKFSFSHDWITDFERSGFLDSPGYDKTMQYFRRFEEKTPYGKMFSIGMSPQGRSIECLIVSKDKDFTPQKSRAHNKAVVLIQNGIHAGEIEGKDAWMLLLRDMIITKEKFHLLDHLNLLIIPILNVDGHERTSEYNRPNQNGPRKMGWRTNSANLNLNRDYLKAETPEIKSFLNIFSQWLPDVFIDNHTTNGADYQYHITYGVENEKHLDDGLRKWGSEKFLPSILALVERDGFLTAPYIQFTGTVLHDGLVETPSLPRLSTGYAAIQNRIGLLVETHSLKPFENRVRSTYSMNLAALEFMHQHYAEIKSLNKSADKRTAIIKSIPVEFQLLEKPTSFVFKGYTTIEKESVITGETVVLYGTEPTEFKVPYFNKVRVCKKISVPRGYIIPQEFSFVTGTLRDHGINYSALQTGTILNVECYSFEESTFAPAPYEGRQRVNVQCSKTKKKIFFPKGTVIVKTNQRTNRVIVNLLEPEAPDSLLSWGFFNAFFERKEYAEDYIMEPIAEKMLKNDRKLRKEFFKKVNTDETFARNPVARLDYLYTQSPYFDSMEKKYPIYRLI